MIFRFLSTHRLFPRLGSRWMLTGASLNPLGRCGHRGKTLRPRTVARQVREAAEILFEELTSEKLFQFVNTDHAASLQRDLSRNVKCVDDPNFDPRYLCGIDAAYEGDTAFVAASVRS